MNQIKYLVDGVWTEEEPKDFSRVEAVEEVRQMTKEEFKLLEQGLIKN